MERLAINGGKKICYKNLYPQPTIGEEEKEAVIKFLESKKVLSGFRGNATNAFWGGEKVQQFEEELIYRIFNINNESSFDFHNNKALAVNSCTSALQIACGAIGLGPGDEVIVTPWSMTCSATAPMIWGATPVFADIENDTFCLDPKSVEQKITSKTKAIIVVDLFGQPYNVTAINKIAKENSIYVIEDAAQAIGSSYNNIPAGTLGDIGCFSFTQGKHLTAGEGGAIVTNNPELYDRCALLRNHAEAVNNDRKLVSECDKKVVGFNMRMTELQAVILIEQLKKLKRYMKYRNKAADYINKSLEKNSFVSGTPIRENCKHSYYCLPLKFNNCSMNISRDFFIQAVKAELSEEENRIDRGVPIGNGYIKPLYRFPVFENRQIEPLPVVEKLWCDELFVTLIHALGMPDDKNGLYHNCGEFVEAINKVTGNVGQLCKSN